MIRNFTSASCWAAVSLPIIKVVCFLTFLFFYVPVVVVLKAVLHHRLQCRPLHSVLLSPFRVETPNALSADWDIVSAHLFLYFVTAHAFNTRTSYGAYFASNTKVVPQHVRNHTPAHDFMLFVIFRSFRLF